MKCPRHHVDLRQKPVGLQVLYICPSCSGLWLTRRAIEDRLGATLGAEIATVSNRTVSSLQCPSDRTLLTEVSVRNISVDHCSQCAGIWLDPGEIEKLIVTQINRCKPLEGKLKKKDPVWIQILDGASFHLTDIIAAIIEGLFDGV